MQAMVSQGDVRALKASGRVEAIRTDGPRLLDRWWDRVVGWTLAHAVWNQRGQSRYLSEETDNRRTKVSYDDAGQCILGYRKEYLNACRRRQIPWYN